MVQGQVKKLSKAATKRKPYSLGPKRGAGVIPPKKASVKQRMKMIKKYTAGSTAQTEKRLAQRAGHLEMIGTGKRDKRKNGAETKK